MRNRMIIFRPLVFLGMVALILAAIALAKPTPSNGGWRCGDDTRSSEHREEYMLPDNKSGILIPAFLRGINLTQAQHDSIFSILNAEAPRVLATEKNIRDAQKLLNVLIASSHYSETEAESLTRTMSDDLAGLLLLRVQNEHRIYGLLTDDQRMQLGNTKAERGYRPICGSGGKFRPLTRVV